MIGCGNIGRKLAEFMDHSQFFDLRFVCDLDDPQVTLLVNQLKNKPVKVGLEELVEKSELIIECASPQAAEKLLQQGLSGKKVMIMSTGGLITQNLAQVKAEVYLPSGAIAGIDALKAVVGLIDSLKLITTKSPLSLQSAPYIIKNKINLGSIKKKKIIFRGNLEEVVKGFPQNLNVAATLYLATKKEPQIEIMVDPETKTNTHEIICTGKFGKLHLRAENLPSENPKTSYLAVLSAIQMLKNLENNIKVGS